MKKEKIISNSVKIPQFKIDTIKVEIEGSNTLIVHHFSKKSILQMQNKQAKVAKTSKYAERDPNQDYLESLYCFKEGDYSKTGMPAVAFKASMVRAGKNLGHSMTDLRTCVFVIPDTVESGLVEIKGKHNLRTDMVRLPNGNADIRYRAEYTKWKCTLNIKYNAGVLSSEQVVSLVVAAGFGCGVGDHRPEKSASGSFGTFSVIE